MDGKSLNLTQELLKQLQAIVPQAFSEGKLDTTALKTLLGEEMFVQGERYGLSWAGKSDAYKVLQQTTTTLIPEPEQSIDWDNAEHVLIEGENLEVLKLLQKSYFGKVKMIYIDPPYNTGNDSFIYPDKFSETKEEYLQRIGDKDDQGYMLREGAFRTNRKESGQYHSNWLNMMLPRLYLARNLLREDGVIFVSIDDNEVANLKLLMDEVFGAENFVAQMIWQNSSRQSPQIAVEHEYVLVYVRSESALINEWTKPREIAFLLMQNLELLKNEGKTIKEAESWLSKAIDVYLEEDEHKGTKDFAWLGNYKNIDDSWNIYYAVDLTGEGSGPPRFFNGKSTPAPQGRHWMGQDYIDELVLENRIVWRSERAYRKLYITESLENLKSIIRLPTRNGSELLKQILGKDIFDKPKPHNFIKKLMYYAVSSSDIILDFFAGSGTTAQAVMELNEEDGGNRRYICVQLPEKTDENSEAAKAGYATIADITAARIKKVIAKIEIERAAKTDLNNNQDTTKPLPHLGFRKFTLAPSNFKLWRGDVIDSEEELLRQMHLFATPQRANATTPDMAWELLLKSGLSLTDKITLIELKDGLKLYHTADKSLVLVLDGYSAAVQEAVLALKPKQLILLDSVFAGRENGDSLKTNAQLTFEDQGIAFKTV